MTSIGDALVFDSCIARYALSDSGTRPKLMLSGEATSNTCGGLVLKASTTPHSAPDTASKRNDFRLNVASGVVMARCLCEKLCKNSIDWVKLFKIFFNTYADFGRLNQNIKTPIAVKKSMTEIPSRDTLLPLAGLLLGNSCEYQVIISLGSFHSFR